VPVCQVEGRPFIEEALCAVERGENEGGVLAVEAENPDACEARAREVEDHLSPCGDEECGSPAPTHPTVVLDVGQAAHDAFIYGGPVEALNMRIVSTVQEPLTASEIITCLRGVPESGIRFEGRLAANRMGDRAADGRGDPAVKMKMMDKRVGRMVQGGDVIKNQTIEEIVRGAGAGERKGGIGVALVGKNALISGTSVAKHPRDARAEAPTNRQDEESDETIASPGADGDGPGGGSGDRDPGLGPGPGYVRG